jgi:hypothetical protein
MLRPTDLETSPVYRHLQDYTVFEDGTAVEDGCGPRHRQGSGGCRVSILVPQGGRTMNKLMKSIAVAAALSLCPISAAHSVDRFPHIGDRASLTRPYPICFKYDDAIKVWVLLDPTARGDVDGFVAQHEPDCEWIRPEFTGFVTMVKDVSPVVAFSVAVCVHSPFLGKDEILPGHAWTADNCGSWSVVDQGRGPWIFSPSK